MSKTKNNSMPNLSVDNSQVNEILLVLKDIIGNVLGVSSGEIDIHTSLLEMGIESLVLLEISRKIQKNFNIKLSLLLFFQELSTVNKLAVYIAQQMPQQEPREDSFPEESISAVSLQEVTSQPVSAKLLDTRFSYGDTAQTLNQKDEKFVPSSLLARESSHNGLLQLNSGSTASQNETVLEESSGRPSTNTAIERLMAQQLQLMSKQIDLLRNGSSYSKILTSAQQSAPLDQARKIAGDSSKTSVSQAQANLDQQPVSQTLKPQPLVGSKGTKSSGLSPRQQKHLDALIARFVKRTQESKRLTQDARPYHANSRAIRGFRPLYKEMIYPIQVQRGESARMWDVDGNEYVDISMGFSTLLFGHSPLFVIEAIQEHMKHGIQHGPESRLAGQVAKLICELTGQERASFANSGTEAVMGAIRLARAATGRPKIALFEDSVHGTLDEVLVIGVPTGDETLRSVPLDRGIPQHKVEQVIVLKYGSLESLNESLNIVKAHAHELAAVLVEPVQSNHPDLQPKEFLYKLRQLTQETGIVLIFDEIITGFRTHPGGVQALWDIRADITTYGKAVAAGLPIGVVAGKAAFMDAFDGGFWSYGDDSYPKVEVTKFGGTFTKYPLTMSVAWAALNHIKNSGPKLQEELNEKTTKLANTLNSYFEQKQLPIRVVHFSSMFCFAYPRSLGWMNLFFYHLLEKGIYVWEGRTFFLSTAHTDEDIEQVIRAVKESVVEMQQGEFLPPSPISNLSPGSNEHTKTIQTREPSIEHVSRDGKLPLSFTQQRIWFLNQLEPSNFSYNEFAALRLMGSLNMAALEQSFNEIIRRHEVLRTSFATVEGQPIQVIVPIVTLTIPMVDLREFPDTAREMHALRLAIEASQQPFDLTQAPLLRCTLLQLDEVEYVLLFTRHHIVSDTWSTAVFLRELAALYEAFTAGKPSPLPELPIQYADFAIWQRQWLQGEVLDKLLAYWQQQLSGNLPVLALPTDRPRPAVQTFHGASQSFKLSASQNQALRALSRQANCTLFMTLLAAFGTLLHRYTKQDDIIVGTDIANRDRPETQGLIGFLINLLALRINLSGNPHFQDLLKQVREVTLGAYAHKDLPFEKLVEVLQPERKRSYTPLCQVLLVLDNVPIMPALALPGLTVSPIEVDNGTSKFDLVLFMAETDQGLVGTWQYNTDLFDATTITRMSGHFQTLLDSIVAQPNARINNIEMLTEAEKNQQATEKRERKAFKQEKFISITPKAVRLSQEKLIVTDYLQPGQTFPLVIQPAERDIDLAAWTKTNQEFIESEILKHGAILFRGFNIESVSEFESVAQAISPNLFGDYGDLPRATESGKVYESTPYPPDKAILLHNESSHLHQFPLKIWFFCIQPAKEGGETPIVDCRKAYQLLNPKLRELLAEKRFMYVRHYTNGLDVSWQDFFRTNDKFKVENYCRQSQMDFEWYDNNGLITRQVRPALAVHPKTGDSVLFNQIQLHHIAYLDAQVRESLLSTFGEKKLPRNVYYGDGTPIEDSVIAEINEVSQQSKTSFPWRHGDILMLDNMLVAHGRYPYVGQRKIVVAMGEMICR